MPPAQDGHPLVGRTHGLGRARPTERPDKAMYVLKWPCFGVDLKGGSVDAQIRVSVLEPEVIIGGGLFSLSCRSAVGSNVGSRHRHVVGVVEMIRGLAGVGDAGARTALVNPVLDRAIKFLDGPVETNRGVLDPRALAA